MPETLATLICAVILVVIVLLLKNCILGIDHMAIGTGGATFDEVGAVNAFKRSQWGRYDTESSPELLNMMYDQRYKQYGEGRGMVYDN